MESDSFFSFLTRKCCVEFALFTSWYHRDTVLMFNQIMVIMGMYHVCLVARGSSLISKDTRGFVLPKLDVTPLPSFENLD